MPGRILTMDFKYDPRFNKEFFKNLSEPLLNDREFIMKALDYNPDLLELLPNEMKDDAEIVAVAFNKTSFAYYHLSDRLKSDTIFITPFIKLHPILIEIADISVRSNRELILDIIDQIGVNALWSASPAMYYDIEVIVKALKSPYSDENIWDSILFAAGKEFEDSKKLIEKAYKEIGDEVMKYNYNQLLEMFNK